MQEGERRPRWRLRRVAAAAALVGAIAVGTPSVGSGSPSDSLTALHRPAIASLISPAIPGCADPGITTADPDGGVAVVCTGTHASDVRLRVSTDLRTWSNPVPLFAAGAGPSWAVRDFWGPELHRIGDGYVLYYSARDTHGRLCIGAATSPSLMGPFTDIGRPLVRDGRFGLIDPTLFRDRDGALYLYWKVDGNAVHAPTAIVGQRLDPSGLRTQGRPVTVLRDSQPWERGVVEGPSVFRHGDAVYMLYSGGHFATRTYAQGFAVSAAPLTPFRKDPANPVLVSGRRWYGPGGGSVTRWRGRDVVALHAFPGPRFHKRSTFTGDLVWDGPWPRISVNGVPGIG